MSKLVIPTTRGNWIRSFVQVIIGWACLLFIVTFLVLYAWLDVSTSTLVIASALLLLFSIFLEFTNFVDVVEPRKSHENES